MMRSLRWSILSLFLGCLLVGVLHAQGSFRPRLPSRPAPPPPPSRPAQPQAPASTPSAASSSGNTGGYALQRLPYWFRNPYPFRFYRLPISAGHNPRVQVILTPRLDWRYVRPVDADSQLQPIVGHLPTQSTYSLWVPRTYRHNLPHALVIFVSSKAIPDDHPAWEPVCYKYNVLLAVVQQGGNTAHPASRTQLTLDVLDDIRRRMNVDTDRVYLSGFSEGARTACEVAFAYPEFFGGVVAIGGASSLRTEPFMRERICDRLGVALITGEFDVTRAEIERYRFPVFRDSEVRTKLWVVPRMLHTMPPSEVLAEAFLWLEAGLLSRRALTVKQSTTRMPEGQVPSPDDWAMGLFEEAKRRIHKPGQREGGLMQLVGVKDRFPKTEGARKAEKLLADEDAKVKMTSQRIYDRLQQEFYYREAKGLDAYLSGPLPVEHLLHKADYLREAIALYEEANKHGPDTGDGQKAARRADQLRKLLPKR